MQGQAEVEVCQNNKNIKPQMKFNGSYKKRVYLVSYLHSSSLYFDCVEEWKVAVIFIYTPEQLQIFHDLVWLFCKCVLKIYFSIW